VCVLLTFCVADIQGPEVEINEDYVNFRACGIGGRGKNIYEFHIELYLPIDPKVLLAKCLVATCFKKFAS